MVLLMFWGDFLIIVIRNRKKSEMDMYEKLVDFFYSQELQSHCHCQITAISLIFCYGLWMR